MIYLDFFNNLHSFPSISVDNISISSTEEKLFGDSCWLSHISALHTQVKRSWSFLILQVNFSSKWDQIGNSSSWSRVTSPVERRWAHIVSWVHIKGLLCDEVHYGRRLIALSCHMEKIQLVIVHCLNVSSMSLQESKKRKVSMEGSEVHGSIPIHSFSSLIDPVDQNLLSISFGRVHLLENCRTK